MDFLTIMCFWISSNDSIAIELMKCTALKTAFDVDKERCFEEAQTLFI